MIILFGLDISNVGSPEFEITKLIEEYLGRQDQFDLSVEEFGTILDGYKFKINPKTYFPVTMEKKQIFPSM